MLCICEWIVKVSFILAKCSYGLFVLSMVLGLVLHSYVITECIDGALSYGGCMYQDQDVSSEVTWLTWGSMALFALGSCFTVIFKAFEIGVTQYKQSSKCDR